MVGAQTLRNLKMMISHNIISNLPVTVEDIEISDKIFDPDAYTLKVIKTRHIPKVLVEDFIETPRELVENNQKLVLCM